MAPHASVDTPCCKRQLQVCSELLDRARGIGRTHTLALSTSAVSWCFSMLLSSSRVMSRSAALCFSRLSSPRILVSNSVLREDERGCQTSKGAINPTHFDPKRGAGVMLAKCRCGLVVAASSSDNTISIISSSRHDHIFTYSHPSQEVLFPTAVSPSSPRIRFFQEDTKLHVI